MPVAQILAKPIDTVDEVLAALAVMMKMNLHICDPIANHFRQGFNKRGMVFLFRKKKRIARRVTSGVRFTSPRNLRPLRSPQGDARLPGPQVSPLPHRFVMVREAHPYAFYWKYVGLGNHLTYSLFDIRRAPNLRIADQFHRNVVTSCMSIYQPIIAKALVD